VGSLKGVGRIYHQTFIDTYSKVAFAKLYDRKNALVVSGHHFASILSHGAGAVTSKNL